MTHFSTSNASYGQKKGWESNCQFDSRPLKVENRPDSLSCRWHATYRWKYLDKGYNFTLDLTRIGGLQKKVMSLQNRNSPNFENFRTSNLGVSGQIHIWV
jgi:hypothetical protein